MSDSGAPIQRETTFYFQLIKVVTSQSRLHVMPTVQSRKDIIARERMSLNMQEASERSDASVGDKMVVYTDSEPHWIRWQDLGDFHPVQRTLTRYDVATSADPQGCIELINPQRAVPEFALSDARTPCLTLLGELYKRGGDPLRTGSSTSLQLFR